MSVRTKTLRTSGHIAVKVTTSSGKEISYHLPASEGENLALFLRERSKDMDQPEPPKKPISWEKLAKDRIEKYKQAGIVLRGARYRENLSQVELAKKTGMHQNEISKIENGKRTVGEKLAKKLAKALNFDYHLLLETTC